MNQLAAWNPHFPPESKTRGRELFNAGKARLTVPGEGEAFRMLVEGRDGKSQVVCLKEENHGAGVTCDTTAFQAGILCECVWAALLKVAALAKSGEGTAALAAHYLALKPKPPKAKRRTAASMAAITTTLGGNQPAWATRLDLIKPMAGENPAEAITLPRRVHYAVRAKLSARHQALVVEVRQRTAGAAGWSKPKPLRLSPPVVRGLYDGDDRRLCGLLMGGSAISEQDGSDRPAVDWGNRGPSIFRCPEGAGRHLLREMIATGRCVLDLEENTDALGPPPKPLLWDYSTGELLGGLEASPEGEPWTLCLVGTERLPETVAAPKTAQDELTELMQEEMNGSGAAAADETAGPPPAQAGDEATPTAGRVPVDLGLRIQRRGLRLDVAQPALLIGGPDGVVVIGNTAAAFDDGEAFRWVSSFRNAGAREPLVIAPEDAERFLETLYMLPELPELDLPESLSKNEQTLEPVPVLELHTPQAAQAHGLGAARGQVVGKLAFAYGPATIPAGQEGRYANLTPEDGGPSRLVRRQTGRERAAVAELGTLGFRPMNGEDENGKTAVELWQIAPGRMPQAISHLLDKNWRVFADQQSVRSGGPPNLSITTGQDWFELRGGSKFKRADGTEETIPLPRLLAAAKSGKPMIRLGDGSMGLLPMEWLESNGLLTEMGTEGDDHLRFHRSQAAMLAATLDSETLARADAGFARIREAVDGFSGIHPEEPPPEFKGQLRPYQKDGMGWMSFLRKTHLGGILADDMGLGKTVQVLAMLTTRAAQQRAALAADPKSKNKASLIVAPRSVVFNWIDEAEKFAPDLKVLCYTGADRASWRDDGFAQYDVVVTTYGLMRRDISSLERISFDCVVLDEAQAIKNPQSQSAKAARALNADHRLALTGTPVENHLGDLWSLFEFLNPGMLGSQTRFGRLIRSASQIVTPDSDETENAGETDTEASAETAALLAAAKAQAQEQEQEQEQAAEGADADAQDPDLPGARVRPPAKAPTAALARVARAIRPFILRRSKEQVLSDLPAKTEQTLRCVMSPEQKRAYDELKAWYRTQLSTRLDADGTATTTGNNAFMVLEALLRLRQAACHPALITGSDPNAPSAKLDELESRLVEIMEEGSKALVFSQFTSFLAIIQKRLEAKGIRTLMLDGTTRNRKEVVAQFQNDKDIPVFLISLKAGGVGLNLTAAEYVFLTDPWWNPAVEAQAIDRAHRIGQTRPVFAYRLVCEDTVEQRILELQDEKRRLANAVIGGEPGMVNAGASLLQSLSKDELLSLFR